MSSADTLKSLLGDNADEKIQAVINSLSSNQEQDSALPAVTKTPALNTDSLNYLLRIKDIIDELGSSNNDSRSNLLLSLKPFMRNSRQHSIDSAVRLLNLTKLTSLFR